MKSENKLMMAAGLSGIWDDGMIKRIRAIDGAAVMPGRRLMLHLMLQPIVSNALLSDPLMKGQGMLSRCLLAAPESQAGFRLWHERKPESDEALERYGKVLFEILKKRPLTSNAAQNELAPRTIKLSPDARTMWIGFADKIEHQLGPAGALVNISGLANKLPEHAARLATVLALVEDINIEEISATHLAAGIKLADHYASEALRLHEGSLISAELTLAQKLLDWLHLKHPGGLVSLTMMYQFGPNGLRDKQSAKKAAEVLKDHGWLRSLGEAAIGSKNYRDVYEVVKGVCPC
jgi:hypothetical protein